MGTSKKRGVTWHYALDGQVRTWPFNHMRVSARLIFSENGLEAIADPKRMHRLRRSFASSWRNARWRDMQLAFLWWLAKGSNTLSMPVSMTDVMEFDVPALMVAAPVSVLHENEPDVSDEDDPDVDDDELVLHDEGEGVAHEDA